MIKTTKGKRYKKTTKKEKISRIIASCKAKHRIKKVTIVAIVAIVIVAIIANVGFAMMREKEAVEKYEAKLDSKNIELEIAKKELNALEGKVKYYSEEEIWAMDLSKPSGVTEEELAPLLQLGLVGLEDTFIEAEKYGVNALFLVSIAVLESGWGTMNFYPNNMFGYGSSGYDTKEDNIMTVAEGLGTNYLPPGGSLYGGGSTASHVNVRYAASSKWDDKVNAQMFKLYNQISDNRALELDKERALKQEVVTEIEKEIQEIKKSEEKRKENNPSIQRRMMGVYANYE